MVKIKRIRPPIKYFGGKYYLADFIVSNFPKNYRQIRYVEPFCGAISVYLEAYRQKGFRHTTILNDKDYGLICLLRVIRDRPHELYDILKNVPYEEIRFKNALIGFKKNLFASDFDRALNYYIVSRMSRSGLKKHFSWSERLRGGIKGDINAWNTSLENIFGISKALENVRLTSTKATDCIKLWEQEVDWNTGDDVLFYEDPPYFPKTRVTRKSYEYEMTAEEHEELADINNKTKAKVIISGYDCEEYSKWYKNWNKKEKVLPNHSGQTKVKNKRVECIWTNY